MRTLAELPTAGFDLAIYNNSFIATDETYGYSIGVGFEYNYWNIANWNTVEEG